MLHAVVIKRCGGNVQSAVGNGTVHMTSSVDDKKKHGCKLLLEYNREKKIGVYRQIANVVAVLKPENGRMT